MSAPGTGSAKSAWLRAAELAARTPEARNRSVDFLRAASITVVVIGHWLLAAPYLLAGDLALGNMLEMVPWTRWLTWGFQVMPLFFIVGGYANSASWEAARRAHQSYGLWTAARLRRLMVPMVPLLLAWALMGAAAHRFGVSAGMIRVGSQVALIPTWFLAVYVLVVVAAPATQALWRRFGMASFWGFALGAVVVDFVAFQSGFELLRWLNYVCVWLGVHQLGYAWRAGRIDGPTRALPWTVGGLAVLIFLVKEAGYPLSMITVPGEAVSNSRPPTLALLALGCFHGGLVLAVQTPMRRWLARPKPWTLTVLVNGTIMTLYLWHVTGLVLVVGLAHLLGDVGFGLHPGSGGWWATRPVWLAVLAVPLVIFVAGFGRYEQSGRRGGALEALPTWRALAGAAGVCAGLAMLALNGIGAENALGVRLEAVVLALVGVALVLGPPRLRGGSTG